jgi:hypothetical protein
LHTFIAGAICVSAIFSAQKVPVRAAFRAAPLTQTASNMSSVFRVQITVPTARDERRLAALGVTDLAPADEMTLAYPREAVLLVTGAQMERLARMGMPALVADELGNLAEANFERAAWVAEGVQPLLSRSSSAMSAAQAGMTVQAEALAGIQAVMSGLSVDQRMGIASLISVDDDGDGLTDTQEMWWCTDPNNANTDGDVNGWKDGQEVAAILNFKLPRTVRWGYGAPFGPPAAWPDFNGMDGNPNTPACNDGDFDTIPDFAEVWMVGSRVPDENTDNDKFDDGQELFGVTYCPGGTTSCGYGTWPAGEYWNYIKATMPDFVRPPGDNLFVSAFPIPQVTVEEGSWHVDRVTTITTQQGGMTENSNTYGSEVRRGQSTSVANQRTWNEWEELSESIETPLNLQNVKKTNSNNALGALPAIYLILKTFGVKAALQVAARQAGTVLAKVGAKEIAKGVVAGVITDQIGNFLGGDNKKDENQINHTITNVVINNFSPAITVPLSLDFDADGIINSLDGIHYSLDKQGQIMAMGFHDVSFAIDRQSSVLDRGLSNVANAILAPRYTETRTNGRSWGGSQTVTTEEYEEHALTEQNAFTTGENWSTAWAVDSSHAANLVFTYTVKNVGTEYAREIKGLIFNVYLNDELITTYPAWQQFPNGVINNLFMTDPPINIRSNSIPLTLEQMKQIDTGGRFRIVVEDYSYDADEVLYNSAKSGGVTVYLEDGVDDNDESVDMYVIPTWQPESVEDVLTRYFPANYDNEGLLNSLWTPEFNGTNPPVFKEHFLSDIAWWNIYMTQPDAGNTPLSELEAQAGSAILIRMNRDSDRDGYQDRVEMRYGTDRNDPASHPTPEILAGYVTLRTGNLVTVTLALENKGTFDAYGIQVTMYSPDSTTTVIDNVVGGNGRVRAGKHVAVGSFIKPPAMGNWSGSTSKPYAIGEYLGPDRTFTFTVTAQGTVGAGSTAVNWSAGGNLSGTINLGSSYQSPLPRFVADGLVVGFNTGYLAAGNWFTVTALTPRDTLRYVINTDPNNPASYTEPVIVVSTNDPQGNRKFVTPVKLNNLGQDLAPFSGQMLKPLEFVIRTSRSVTTTEPNTTSFLFNSPHNTVIDDARLYLDFVSDGVHVLNISRTLGIQPGPNLIDVAWSTSQFTQTYDANKDNILIAHWTDSENNIIDSAARPLSLFVPEAKPALAMNPADVDWDFGTAAQGTLLKRSLALGNAGLLDLLTYINSVPGLSLSQTGSRGVGPADVTHYELALNTQNLPVGPYDQTFTIRSSDPIKPAQAVRVHGTVSPAVGNTQAGPLLRPLDVSVVVSSGVQGNWITYTHNLGPNPQVLHPVKVYTDYLASLVGVGKYATDFSAGTASAEMFGDGRDGVMPSSGNLNNDHGAAAGIVNSGSAGSTSITVSDAYAVARINPGDVVLIHQTQGTNAGAWELNKAVSDFTDSGTFTLQKPLQYNYSTSGNNKAQILRVPQYSICNVTGTVTPLAGWNGNWGGILAVMCSGTMTVSGSINASGYGYRGGAAPPSVQRATGRIGETWVGDNNIPATSRSSSATGGGGAYNNNADAGSGGGGGGYASSGTSGAFGHATNGSGPGQGGGTVGYSDLNIQTFFGGGGGSGSNSYTSDQPNNLGGAGGAGGGFVYITAAILNVTGQIATNGANGLPATGHATGNGAGGAGGSLLIRSKVAILNASNVGAVGGLGANAGAFVIFGGDGGVGRIRVEHCDTLTGTTNPPSSTQKLNCHIVEQIESAPYTQGRLNLPANVYGSATYKVQYGRKLNFAAAGNQLTQLRLPAGLLSSVSLDALFSSMSSSAAFSIDVGDDGSVDWNGTAANAGAQTSTQLANALNAYWSTHGAPSSGTIDVPLRVSLAGAGQVLLTNLQTQLSGSPLRFVRLNAESYSNVAINYTLAGTGNSAMTIAADVGDNGSIDWTTSANVALPYTANTANLSSAISAWLAGKSGEQDVPVRFFVSPGSASLTLNSFMATPATLPDPSIALADVSFTSNDVTEGDTVGVQITPRNSAGQPIKGFMASVFASPAGSSPVYIGSAFVPALPANGSATVNVPFSTFGFTGTTPVRVMLDPTRRLSETNAGNNTVTATLAIVTRPDLVISNVLPSDAQPVVGQPVTITVNISNTGQRNAGAQTVSLYAGLPAAGNSPLATQSLASLNGGSNATVSFIWVPTATLTSQLVAVVDAGNQINEFNEGNNTALLTLTAGFSGIRSANSGVLADDPAYAAGQGFGYIDIGQSDVMGDCGSTPDKTFRRDPDGKVLYRFDHLQPGRFYHLDVVLYECNQGAGRQEYIRVDGATLAGPIDLGPDKANNVSLLLDPALYADRTISVSIEAGGGLGALVNSISLREVDYRYVDAGSASDAIYSASRGYGWLDNPTAVNASCGSLPSRTSRVDQNDNELRYRFDNLKPFKSYRVLFSFYQCTGTNVTQRIYIDDPPVGNDITIQANTLYTATRVVPASTYNTDGSIVVSIRRTDAGVGAMVSEIALEESTEKPTCSVQPTPATAQAYGVVRIDGNLAPAGTIVLAENPRGDTVGCFSVTTAGSYGFMPVYGEDAGASPPIGGMREGEIVLFRVNGAVAASTPRMTWTNSLSPVQINLEASYSPAQPVQLSTGWNFMSFRMQPPLPLVDVTLNSIRGKYCRVMGEAGLNYCTVPEQFRTILPACHQHTELEPVGGGRAAGRKYAVALAHWRELGRLSSIQQSAGDGGVAEHRRSIPACCRHQRVLRRQPAGIHHVVAA